MCEKHRTGLVLSIFRNMLIKQGEFKLRKNEENNYHESFREVAIGRCISGFPGMLREQCLRYKIVMESTGIWFAHTMAYTNVNHLKRNLDLFVDEIVRLPEYRTILQQVMQYLTTKALHFTPEMETTIQDLMRIANAEMDVQRVLYKMLLKLEEEERIRIEFPKTLCLGCGTKIKMNQGLCPECQKDESIRKRLSILKTEATKYASRPKVDTAVEKLGMYTRQER